MLRGRTTGSHGTTKNGRKGRVEVDEKVDLSLGEGIAVQEMEVK